LDRLAKRLYIVNNITVGLKLKMTYFLGSSHLRRFKPFMPETSDRRYFARGGARLVGIQKTVEFRNMMLACRQRCPQNIVIMLGSNDVESVTEDKYPGQRCCPSMANEVAEVLVVELIELITAIVSQVGLGPDIYVIDMMPRQKMGTYEAVKQLYNSKLNCLGFGVRVIRWSRAVRRNHLRRDGVHVSDHAYVKLADVMAREVPTI
jgi:lysophospholipase L1-like esterase